jgi:hypothetical protein
MLYIINFGPRLARVLSIMPRPITLLVRPSGKFEQSCIIILTFQLNSAYISRVLFCISTD